MLFVFLSCFLLRTKEKAKNYSKQIIYFVNNVWTDVEQNVIKVAQKNII